MYDLCYELGWTTKIIKGFIVILTFQHICIRKNLFVTNFKVLILQETEGVIISIYYSYVQSNFATKIAYIYSFYILFIE